MDEETGNANSASQFFGDLKWAYSNTLLIVVSSCVNSELRHNAINQIELPYFRQVPLLAEL